VIFGLVKLKTSEQSQTPVGNQLVAEVPQKVDTVKASGQGEENITDQSTAGNTNGNADRSVKPVVYRPAKPTYKTTPAPKTITAEPVRLLPGERSYLQAIARLDTTIKANKKDMRPSLQVEYERNLAVVDRAIAATRSAAKSNPNDPDAADFMFAAYQSKVDLLNTIADARVGGGRSH
jgi:hypothetical protein